MRAELLLETSGLTRQEQLMIRLHAQSLALRGTATFSSSTMGRSTCVIPETWHHLQGPFSLAGKNKGKGWCRSGYFAGEYEGQDGDEAAGYDGNQDWQDNCGEGAYVGYGDEPGTTDDPDDCDWVSDEDLGLALTAMAACDVDEATTEGFEELGEACQHQLQAYAAVDRTNKGKGPFNGSGKGKDKGKGKGKRVVKTQLSIQDRKVRWASLKKNSRCDPECKMPNKKPDAKPRKGWLLCPQ